MSARTAVVLVLLAPALAGCVGQSETAVPAPFDPTVPRCVGDCARVVDDSRAPAIEPHLAVNPLNPDHIVIAHIDPSAGDADPTGTDLTAERSRVSVTEDGGATWETRAVPGGLLNALLTHPLAPYKRQGTDPVVAFLPDGTLVMSGLDGAAVGGLRRPGVPVTVFHNSVIYTMRSTDGGYTWGDARIVDDGGEGLVASDAIIGASAGAMSAFNDKPWLAGGSDGTLLLAWTQIVQGHPDNGFSQEWDSRLLFSSSEDGGLTWSPAALIDDQGFPTGSSPVVGRDGAWRVAYLDAANFELRFAESHDRGQTWDARSIGATAWLPALRAQTLASGVERLLLTFATGGDWFGGEHQTEFTWSDDGGSSWAPTLVIDMPEGEGPSMPDVAGGAGDSAWITYFDVEGPRAEQRSRYLAVKVVDGVAGAPLVLDNMDTAALNLGHYMGLGTMPDGDAVAAWVTRDEGQQDVVWARITGGDEPVAQVLLLPATPRGLAAPMPYEFTGHVNVPGCYVESHPALEQAARDHVTFAFEVPPDTRFVDGTLDWETHGPAGLDDLDLLLYDAEGDYFDAPDEVPETFRFELQGGDQGTWTAVVRNCENPPTDFTLSLRLS